MLGISTPKREAALKHAAMAELTRQLPHFLVLQLADAGGPDRLIAGAGRVTAWEFKHGTPEFKSPGNQALLCARLEVQAYCRYVVWQENNGVKRTMIVRPRIILEREELAKEGTIGARWDVIPEDFCTGFNHRWLVERIRKVHGV